MRSLLRYIVILAIISFVLSLIPFGVGILFKQNYLNLIQKQYEGRLEVQEYHLGWFESTAKLYYKMPAADKSGTMPAGAMPTGVTIDEHIIHGPYAVDPSTNIREFVEGFIVSTVHLDPAAEKFYNIPSDGLMQAQTSVSFSNTYTSDFHSAVIGVKTPDYSLSWQGLSGTSKMEISDSMFAHISGDLVAGTLNEQGANNSFSISGAKINVDATCGENRMCVGKHSVQIPAVLAVNHAGEAAKITNVSVMSTSSDTNNNFNNNVKISLGSMSAPSFSLGASSLNLAYANLNATEFTNLLEKVKADRDANSDPTSQRLVLAGDINSGLIKVLTPQSTMTNDLLLSTSNGNLTANMKISFPPNQPMPQSAMELPMKAQVSLNLRVAASLVEAVIKTIDEKNAAINAAKIAAQPEAPIISPSTDFEAGLPAFTQFQIQVNNLVTQKAISPQLQASVYNMVKLHKNVQDFNAFVDNLTRSRQIQPAPASQLKLNYAAFYNIDVKNILNVIFSATTPNLRTLQMKIGALGQINIISQTTANELIDLQNQSLAPEIYRLALHRFVVNNVIPAELETELDANYGYINKDLSLNADSGMGMTAPGAPGALPSSPGMQGMGGQLPNQAPQAEQAAVGELQSQFDTFVKDGYIVRNGDDFVVSITYSNGVVKVNGLPFTADTMNQISKAIPAQSN
jgi:uncharacterized protein YdgA (DUF945 family)